MVTEAVGSKRLGKCVYMHVYTRANVHVCSVYVCVHARAYLCMCVYMHVCM